MATQTKEEPLYVQESGDGTATVELPENLLPHDDGDEPTPRGDARDDAGDEDHPDDSDAVRAARRARRRSKKDLIRKTNEEKDVRLQMLQRQNEEMANRLSQVERRTQGADMARLEKAIDDEQVRVEYHRMKLSEATSSGDGEAAVAAQEALYDARQKVEQLNRLKQQADRPTDSSPRIDPGVQRHAAQWIDRNGWYKPDLSDTDSKIAKVIDEDLVKEGWNPGTADYWDELDARLQKRLPHRYNESSDRRDSPNRTPRNTVGSSGREASAAYGGTNRTFTLTAEQVRAMKDAGMWDNPEKRAKMIKRYAEQARNTQRSN
jgi:hypothetical protein